MTYRALLLCLALAAANLPTLTVARQDVLPVYHNREVTTLCEDAETLRLALGAAWDDAQACRAYSGYVAPWTTDAPAPDAEVLLQRGTAMYELVKCLDDGVNSVRLARDTRDEPRLTKDIAFWRNELALGAAKVTAYAGAAATLKATLAHRLQAGAQARKITAQRQPPLPWADPEREAWRRAGPAAGVRLPVDALPGSLPAWWNDNLSVSPYYIATKLAAAGDRFFTPEMAIGAWGYNCTGPGQYDWTRLNRYLRDFNTRKLGLLLELPTLQESKSDAQMLAAEKLATSQGVPLLDRYAPALPAYLTADPQATLLARDADGTTHLHGGAQLFNPVVARAYGDYLHALAANLRQQGVYDTVVALHLERGDWAILPETVDYSPLTRERWQASCRTQYTDIAQLNAAAGTAYASFADLPLPVRVLPARARAEWEAFTTNATDTDANAWGRYLQGKYKTFDGIRAALGDDYKDGYNWRLPFDYPPVLKIDYLRFRRQWVQDYLTLKRRLVRDAFPDKLIITELRQFGDHDGVAGKGEEKWGGFLNDDLAQWSGVGPENATRPFMIRSVGPVGFGSRVSDSLESLYRDYLWLNFREPGNLARYFYDWVAHGYIDEQLGWQSITNHWLTNRLLYQLGPTVANTAPETQRIGLLLPRATFDLNEGSIYDAYLGWDWMLHAAKLPYTRVDEHLVRDGKLKALGLQVLILPEVRALDGATARNLAAWAREGGTLLVAGLPLPVDDYGRPLASPVADIVGAHADGVSSAAVKDTPLTVTIPHGFYSGMWAKSTDRAPAFTVLAPTTASVLARYDGGQPAITLNRVGAGRVIAMGYPFGSEAVQMDRTSIGFYRTYVYFAREPQLVARTAWLRKFLLEDVGYQPEYGVDAAEVGRFSGNEAIQPGFHAPKGLGTAPDEPHYVRTFGDPRPDHQMMVAREAPDMALRFFPRVREGVATRYLGISTRETHYMAPRADVQMYLTPHIYHCRVNNPKIQAIWDVARNVPVGFSRDAQGVAFTVSLPSGHIMMLALSDTPTVQLFDPAPFPGREPAAVLAQVRKLTGGRRPPVVANLTPTEILPWFRHLTPPAPAAKSPVLISYGQAENRPAADRLAAYLRTTLGLDARPVAQTARVGARTGDWADTVDFDKALIFIGNEWTNNDMALHGAYWGLAYGPHLPFTATYAWPGAGRAVISLSRRYALLDDKGHNTSYRFYLNIGLRKVEDSYPLFRRKLYIAADGTDALVAVNTLIAQLERK